MTASPTKQTATLANVASATGTTVLFAANGRAMRRTVWNDSSAILYIKFGTGASSTSCTVPVAVNGYYEFPLPLYGGTVEGAWASANGFARTTEY